MQTTRCPGGQDGLAPSRTLFIHAGTHKTGTTSIQHLLQDRREAILAHGCQVIADSPAPQGDRMNCAAIAHAFIRPGLWTPTRINGTKPARFADRRMIDWLQTQIESTDCRRHVLSAEALCYLRTTQEHDLLRATLDRLGCRPVPVLYFRNPLDWRRSWADQLDKQPRVKAFMVRHPDRFRLLEDWYFDADAIRAFWRSVSPDAVFLDYDAAVAQSGSVLPSFLALLGLPAALDTGSHFLNRRRPGAAGA